MKKPASLLTAAALTLAAALAYAAPPALQLRFSCSHSEGENAARLIYADSGRIELSGDTVREFQWESALHRATHGNECSIDQSDGLSAQLIEGGWRVRLTDGAKARIARGYDYEHGVNCTIRVLRQGDEITLKPSCPALCGSRENFSELTIHRLSGVCRYARDGGG